MSPGRSKRVSWSVTWTLRKQSHVWYCVFILKGAAFLS